MVRRSAPELVLELTDDGTALNLRSADLDAIEDPNLVLAKAKTIAEWLSGFCDVFLDSQRPIQIGGVYINRNDGTKHQFVFLAAILSEERLFVPTILMTRADGIIVPSQRPARVMPELLSLAESDPKLAETLQHIGRVGDLVSLYKAFELIRSRLGEDGIASRGWATKREMERFRRTALAARHAVVHGGCPRNR